MLKILPGEWQRPPFELSPPQSSPFTARGGRHGAIMSFDHLDVSKAGWARNEKRGAFRTPRRIDN
jgi:hypothetical protein